MLNTSRKNSEIKDNAEHLLTSVKENVVDITHEAGNAALKLGRHVQSKSKATKEEAMSLLESVKEFIGPKVSSAAANEIKEQLAEQLVDWKDSIQQELEHTLKVTRVSSRKALQKRTLLTLGAVFSVGLLIGYLASSSSAEPAEEETPEE